MAAVFKSMTKAFMSSKPVHRSTPKGCSAMTLEIAFMLAVISLAIVLFSL